MIDALIVLAKQPLPGRVKTRLMPFFAAHQAAAIAAAALRDTLAAVTAAPVGRRILAFDGDPTGWLPDGWEYVAQPDGGQAERMIAAFEVVGAGSAALVAMDTPQLAPSHLAPLVCPDATGWDACLGRTPDGGYWTIALRDARLAAPVLTGIPMSTAHTADEQLRRLHSLGLHTRLLDELTDVDTADDAHAVAASAPHTLFARAVRAAAVPADAC